MYEFTINMPISEWPISAKILNSNLIFYQNSWQESNRIERDLAYFAKI